MDAEDLKENLKLMRDRKGLAYLLGITVKELTFIAYKLNRNRYTKFQIKKRKGGLRDIEEPHPLLKKTQRKLLLLLQEFYPAPVSAHGFVNQRSILTNSAQHIQKRCVLNFDLKDFFPSINGARVYSLFKAPPFELTNEAASTLSAIICHKGKLPQGAPTSPLISNMICYKMDKQLIRFAKFNKVSYSRYADDITLSTYKKIFPKPVILSKPNEEIVLGEELTRIVTGNGFKIHPDKNRLYTHTKSKYVTGIKVNTKQNLDRKYIRNIRSILKKIENGDLKKINLEFNQKYNFRNGHKNILTTVAGRIEHVKNVKGYFDPVYRKLQNRLVAHTGHGIILPEEEVDQLYSKIFVVVGRGQGTGFIIGDYLVTCKHVVVTKRSISIGGKEQEFLNDDPLSEIEFFTHENFGGQSRLRATNPKIVNNLDMVVYRFSKLHRPEVEHRLEQGDSNSIAVGDRLSAFGFTNYKPGNKCDYVPTIVSSTEMDKYGIKEFNLDRPLFGGMSGGPVLNEDKQVVGVIARGVRSRESNNYDFTSVFLPINEVARIISE